LTRSLADLTNPLIWVSKIALLTYIYTHSSLEIWYFTIRHTTCADVRGIACLTIIRALIALHQGSICIIRAIACSDTLKFEIIIYAATSTISGKYFACSARRFASRACPFSYVG